MAEISPSGDKAIQRKLPKGALNHANHLPSKQFFPVLIKLQPFHKLMCVSFSG
jgi:hypothetical protein